MIIPSPWPPLSLTSDMAADPLEADVPPTVLIPSCSVRYSHGRGGVAHDCSLRPQCPELMEGRVCFSLWERSPVFPGEREMARKTSGGSLMGHGV